MRHSSKVTLLLFAFTLSAAAHAQIKPQCNSGGKGSESGYARNGGGKGQGGGSTAPGLPSGQAGQPPVMAGTPVTGGESMVNPGAPEVVLPGGAKSGTPTDNGTDRVAGTPVDNGTDRAEVPSADNGTDGKVQSVKLRIQTLRAKLAAKKKELQARANARRKGKGPHRPNPLDGMIASNSHSILKTQSLSQTAFEEPVRAPASVSTSYDFQPTSLGAR